MGLFDMFKKRLIFVFNEEYERYEAKMNDIIFTCEQVRNDYEKDAIKLASVYEQKLTEIIAFLLSDIQEVFGVNDVELIRQSLGTPEIDLDNRRLSYLNQTLDDVHIIDIEYNGLLDEFLYSNIDG